jgi:hypothetical protein
MKNALLSLLLLLGFLATSCRTSALLNASFESETIGSRPTRNIPGAPEGDEINFPPDLAESMSIIASSTAGEKALQFSMNYVTDPSAHNSQWLSFRGIATNLTQPLYFYYTATQPVTFGELTIDVSDGRGGLMARMHIRNDGHVFLSNNFFGSVLEVGTIPLETSHTVVFAVNVRSGTYNLVIFKRGGNLTVNNHPFFRTGESPPDPLDFANPAYPTIAFHHSFGRAPQIKYIIESVSISKKRPE